MGQLLSLRKPPDTLTESGAVSERVLSLWRNSILKKDGQSSIYLGILCQNVKKMDLLTESDPFAIVYYLEKDPEADDIAKYFVGDKMQVQGSKMWTKIGETAYKNNDPNPVFEEVFEFDYKPEVIQRLRIEIYDYDITSSPDFIGASEFIVQDVMRCDNASQTFDMENIKNKEKPTGRMTIALFDAAAELFVLSDDVRVDVDLGSSLPQPEFSDYTSDGTQEIVTVGTTD